MASVDTNGEKIIGFQYIENIPAFLYKWTDHERNMFYVGAHKGHPDDGYVCSSKYMLEEYKERPEDFSREILLIGTP